MKTTRYCLTLPYLEVVKELKYELRWGCIRGILLSQTEVSPQVTVLLLQVENQSENTVLIIDHLRSETQLRIIEPETQGWDQILASCFCPSGCRLKIKIIHKYVFVKDGKPPFLYPRKKLPDQEA